MRTVMATAALALALLGTAACGAGEPDVPTAAPSAAASSPAEAGEGDVAAACETIKAANRAMFEMPGIVLLVDATSTPDEAAEAAAALTKAFTENIETLTKAAGQTKDAELLAAIDRLVTGRTADLAEVKAAGRDGAKVAEARGSDASRDGERAVLGICNR
ncbi:hypothetical protein [Catellatospora sp. NPDC049609]|uniref:hypothetical protein n=1 Tax=Catellatospora sp. NPDC049609 TaxID=3155505 RepID=UPI003416F0D4